MPVVSIEQDAKYRRDGDRYVEVCRSCDVDRAGDRCACGATFERLKRSFFALAWKPTDVKPKLPPVCPHCEGATTHVRSITLALPTALRGVGSFAETRITVEVPSCRKMLPPFFAYLLFITAIFVVVVFGFAALFGKGLVAYAGTALALAGAWAAWRAYAWLRFTRFDHRSIRLRARRPGYARQLADRNGGRVL